MARGNFPPSQHQPECVHSNRQASGLFWFVHHFVPEWPQCVLAQFEQLYPEGYANYGDAHHQTHHKVDYRYNEPAQHEPQQIPNSFHITKIAQISQTDHPSIGVAFLL